jgi:hypothetical protein
MARAYFLGLQYGQKRPGEATGRSSLPRVRRSIASILPPHDVVISGRVSDDREPLAGVSVFPMQASIFAAEDAWSRSVAGPNR